jgi:hypothetical protein
MVRIGFIDFYDKEFFVFIARLAQKKISVNNKNGYSNRSSHASCCFILERVFHIGLG